MRTMMVRVAPPAWALVIAVLLVALCGAELTGSFADAIQGSSLLVSWDAAAASSSPLYLTLQAVNTTADGSTTGWKANVTASVNGTSFLWRDVPHPLEWIATARYQLELLPLLWEGTQQPVLGTSPWFSIAPASSGNGTDGTDTGDNTSQGGSSSSGVNLKVAIALVVVIGVALVVALGVIWWCWQKKRKRAAEERRWENRRNFVIE